MLNTNFATQTTLPKCESEPTPFPPILPHIVFAGILGAVAVLLFYEAELGLNFAVWNALLIACTFTRLLPSAHAQAVRLLLVLALAPGLCFLWSDSPPLRLLSLLAWASILCFAAFRAKGQGLFDMPILRSASMCILWALHMALVPIVTVVRSLESISGMSSAQGRLAVGILRGVLLLSPLLVIYLLLFSAADLAYSQWLENALNLNWEGFYLRLFIFVFFFMLALAVLQNTVSGINAEDIVQPKRPKEMGVVEVNTVLYGMNLLFLSFVLLQASHFFGGDTYIQQTPDLSYAEYAKGGFFQLIFAAALIIPLLLSLDWLCLEERGRGRRAFSIGVCLLLAQVALVELSAVHRLWLYMDAYGLTLLRVFGAVALLWIAGLLIACGILLLTQQRRRFIGVAWCWSLALLFSLYVFSPDVMVMRVNLERMEAGKALDLDYFYTLSAESVPLAIGHLEKYPEFEKEYLNYWRQRLEVEKAPDYRSWNYGAWQARKALSSLPS